MNMENKENKYKMTHEECKCTKQDFIDSLMYLPSYEIEKMLEVGYVEAVCENCGTEYKVLMDELQKALSSKITNCASSCSDCSMGCNITEEEFLKSVEENKNKQ